MSIVVTGGTGFIGTRLLIQLASKFPVTCLALGEPVTPVAGVRYLSCDLTDFDKLNAALGSPQIVVHLAALNDVQDSLHRPLAYFEANLRATVNLLEASRVRGVKKVLLTSTAALYQTKGSSSLPETTRTAAANPYTASKYCVELWARIYRVNFGLPVLTFRLFNVYGPGQLNRAVIPKIIYQTMTGNELTLGNVDARRDFVYVGDVAAVITKAVERPWPGGHRTSFAVNVGSGHSHSIKEVASTVAELLGKNTTLQANIGTRPKATENQYLEADVRKASKLFDWRPDHDLKSGLKETVTWYRDHFEQLEKVFRNHD